MLEPILIFGALDDWFGVIVFLIFVLGPILKGLFTGNAQKPQQQRPRQRRPPQRPPQAGGGADKLENEIEEFLRRAAGGQPPARPPAQAEPVRAEIVPGKPDRAQPVRSKAPQPMSGSRSSSTRGQKRKPKSRSRAPQRPQPSAKRPAPQKIQRRSLSSAPLDPVGGDADEFGSSIDREVDQMEEHVHEVFDHQLGSLGQSSGAGDDVDDRGTDSEVWEGTSVRRAREAERRIKQAEDMRKMLRDPKSIHQAVLMAEILKRPDF